MTCPAFSFRSTEAKRLKFLKNRFFIICLTVALCLTVFSSVMAATGNASFVKDMFGILSSPIRFVFNKTYDAFSGFADYFTEFDRLRSENEELRAAQSDYEKSKSEADALREENEWLRNFFSIEDQDTEFSLCDATVIGRSAGTTYCTLTLNKGSINGISSGMAVMNEDGVVGKVSEVGLFSCEVVCITDISSSIGACIERSALVGICDGVFGGQCSFLYTTGIQNFEDIVSGDTVISSGKGSIYPYGIKIGTVSDVRIDEASRSVSATVEPAVDFSTVKRVMIITQVTAKENDQ